MKQIVNRNLPRGSSSRIGVLRLELDYELATLYDAMQNNDDVEKQRCKQKLERLRKEWIRLHS